MFDENQIPVFLISEKNEMVVQFSMLKEHVDDLDFVLDTFGDGENEMLSAFYPKKNCLDALSLFELGKYIDNYSQESFESQLDKMTQENHLTYRNITVPNPLFLDHFEDNRLDMVMPLCVDYPFRVFISSEVRRLVKNGRFRNGISFGGRRLPYVGIHESRHTVLLSPPTVVPPSNFKATNDWFDVLKYIEEHPYKKSTKGSGMNTKEVLSPVDETINEKSLLLSRLPESYLLETSLDNRLAYTHARRTYPVIDYNPDNFDPEYPLDEFLDSFYVDGLVEVAPLVLVPFSDVVKDDYLLAKARQIISEYLGIDHRHLNLARPYDCHGDRFKKNGLVGYHHSTAHRVRPVARNQED